MSAVSVEQNKAIVRRYWEEAYGREGERNLGLIDELFAPDFPNSGGRPPGPAGKRAGVEALIAAFPDIRCAVDRIIGEGDEVAVFLTLSGTHRGPYRGIAPTGKFGTISGMEWFRLADGKIVEQRASWDYLTILQNLGAKLVLPEAGTG